MPDLPAIALLAATATTHTDHDITPEMLGDYTPDTPLDRVRDQLAVLLDTETDITVAIALQAHHTVMANAYHALADDVTLPERKRTTARTAYTHHVERANAYHTTYTELSALLMRGLGGVQ